MRACVCVYVCVQCQASTVSGSKSTHSTVYSSDLTTIVAARGTTEATCDSVVVVMVVVVVACVCVRAHVCSQPTVVKCYIIQYSILMCTA